eukprot:Nk52_evm1s598 gene=Nk52_evmTU1s598
MSVFSGLRRACMSSSSSSSCASVHGDGLARRLEFGKGARRLFSVTATDGGRMSAAAGGSGRDGSQMLYAIFCEDKPGTGELRKATRPSHLKNVDALNAEGRIILAGPHPIPGKEESGEVSGSLIVAKFESLEEAEKWINSDPYSVEGVFAKTTVKPFKQVYP